MARASFEVEFERWQSRGMRRLLIWSGVDAWRAEAATVELGPGGLSATGTQLGREPLPYRLDYALELGVRSGADADHHDPSARGERPEVCLDVGRSHQLEHDVEGAALLEALRRDRLGATLCASSRERA